MELLEAARLLGIRTIYDIGANVGTWALLAKAVIPEATVEAFEPLPKHCAEFGNNLRGVYGVRVHPVALGPANTYAPLLVTDISDASSLLPLAQIGQAEFSVKEIDRVGVQVFRLDDFRSQQGLQFPELIKLDVQGYELEVLKGATECLRHTKALVVEVSFAEYYDGQCLFHELIGFLAEFGLFVAALGAHTPTGVMLSQTDVLFLRRS